MAEFKKFHIRSLKDLREEITRLKLVLPISNNIDLLKQPVQMGQRTLPNRFVVQPMEGIDANPKTGAPSELTFRRYKRFAEGGAGVIWFEAAVVDSSGKSNPRQLMLTHKNIDIWKKLISETREVAKQKWGWDIVTIIQLAHSGRWSKPEGSPKPILIQHNPLLDKSSGVTATTPLMTDEEIDKLKEVYREQAKLAVLAGFDGVEMKAVHGYLCGEMLGSRIRHGRYGGSYENRTRFVKECTQEIKEILPENHFVTARLTMWEPSPYPFGWGVKEVEGSTEMDLTEPFTLAKELVAIGNMPIFNFSIGYPRFDPHINRPFNTPLLGQIIPPEHPLEGITRFQQVGKALQETLGEVPVVTAALGWLREFMPFVAAGLIEQQWVSLIGQGRQSFAYPNSVSDVITKGKMDASQCCITCSLCSQIMKDVVGCNGCPVRDKEIYRKELQKGRKQARELGVF